MAFVLLKSPGGGTTTTNPVTSIGPITVATTDTDTIDSVLCSFTTVKWLLTVIDSTAEDQHSIEIYARCKPAGINAADVTFTCYASIADYINYGLDVVLSGANMELQVTNNEPNNVVVSAVRIQVT